MILHIDMDAFFASIEQAINPRLKGKPLIVGSRGNKMHTVVCAASYEAKALGIGSGMPSAEAFKICPNLEFVAAEQSKYIWTSEQIFDLLKGYNFKLAYASIDEFQLDIADDPDPENLAQKIQKQIHDTFKITASIGIGKNYLLAKLASKLNKPNGIAIIEENNLQAILSKVPAKKLCGIGKSSEEILLKYSIKTCLDLYQKSAEFLESIFGKNGTNLYLSLHAQERLQMDDQESKPKSIGHSYTLPRTSNNPGFIHAWMMLLSEMVGQRLRQSNLTANTVHLWLNGPEIGNFSGQKTFQIASNDSYEVYQRSLKIMAKLGQNTPKVRAIGITCSSLLTPDCPLLFNEQKRREALIKSLDQINNKFGDNSIYPAVINLTKNIP